MKTPLSLLMAALVCAGVVGCSTTQRETTNQNGVTTKSKNSTFWTTFQGYDDSIDANGAQHTSIANYAVDTQALIAMDNLLTHLLQNAAVFIAINNGGTNATHTNALAILMQRQQQDQAPQVTASRHYYRAPK